MIGGLRDTARLIEQIEADLRVRNSFIARGELGPVKSARLQGLLVGPQIKRFGGGIHTVARRAMEIHARMNLVLLAELDGLIYLL